MPEFPGELSIAYGADPIAPARGIQEFAKKFKDNLSILGGVFEAEYKDAAAMKDIASIPPREVLYAQIANILMSPMQGFAVALSEVAKTKN